MKRLICILLSLIPFIGNAQQTWYKSSPLDYMWTNVGNAGFSAGSAWNISLAFSPSGEPHVAFTESGFSGKATVMKFDGTNWVNVGTEGFSAGQVAWTSLAFSLAGLPYVAFEDEADSGKATVMKFDGTSWANVGNAGFSAGQVWSTSLAFSPSGEPCVAYEDQPNHGKATVMKFDGTNWVNVGNAGFSDSVAWDTRLVFNPFDGQPYVAFADESFIFGYATLMKFNGTGWVKVGNAGFSGAEARDVSLAFNPSGEPYVGYGDYGNSQKETVMKYDGTNWVNVGYAGFSAGTAWYTSLAFSPSGEPYVAFVESGFSGKATVMKFDGTNWSYVGLEGFSTGSASFTTLAFSPSGHPYLAYQDDGDSGRATVMDYNVPLGMNEIQSSNFIIYPNPAKINLNIEIKNAKGLVKFIQIYDLREEKLFETKTEKEKIILNVENFPTGIYFVKVKTESSNWIGKFCKD